MVRNFDIIFNIYSTPSKYFINLYQENTSCFIQGDGWFLTPSLSLPVSAFHLLFKVYYVFNLQFPTSLINFFNFFANYVYGIDSIFMNSVSSLHININNFKNMSSEPSTSNAE